MIKINQQQLDFLKSELGISELPNYKEAVHSLLIKLAELFNKKGLKENSEPNEYGLKIEELIDIFSREYYK